MKALAMDSISAHARNISAAATEVDALLLGVEGMIEDQINIMKETGAQKFLIECELWTGIQILLNLARRKSVEMEADGTAIQNEAIAA